jgi:hypothetical protein
LRDASTIPNNTSLSVCHNNTSSRKYQPIVSAIGKKKQFSAHIHMKVPWVAIGFK